MPGQTIIECANCGHIEHIFDLIHRPPANATSVCSPGCHNALHIKGIIDADSVVFLMQVADDH